MKSVIDVIHSVFEVDLGPDLISDLDRIDHKLLFRFRESYAAFANSSVLPTKDQTELRPLATYRALGYTEHLRIDGFLNELDKPALQEDEVKKHLLYCHSLVLDDPLPFILDHFSGRGASGKSRARLASYFAFLNHVKPVVEENILSFVDLLKHRPDREDPLVSWERLKEIAQGLDTSDIPNMYRDTPNGAPCLVSDALESFYMTLKTSEEKGDLDLYLPVQGFTTTLKAFLRGLPNSPTGWKDAEAIQLREVLALSVPNLEVINPADVVTLRRNEETFQKWRLALRRAIERIRQLRVDELETEDNKLKVINEEFSDIEHSVTASLTSKGVVRARDKAIKGCVLNVLSSLALSPFFDPTKTMAVGALREGIELLYAYLKRGEDVKTRAVMRHVYAFRN